MLTIEPGMVSIDFEHIVQSHCNMYLLVSVMTTSLAIYHSNVGVQLRSGTTQGLCALGGNIKQCCRFSLRHSRLLYIEQGHHTLTSDLKTSILDEDGMRIYIQANILLPPHPQNLYVIHMPA